MGRPAEDVRLAALKAVLMLRLTLRRKKQSADVEGMTGSGVEQIWSHIQF